MRASIPVDGVRWPRRSRLPAAAFADTPATAPIAGTRLEISADGQVTRAPDIATLSAGVVTQSTSAASAMADNAKRMAAAIAALRHAGIADKDIRTASLSLQPQYRYADGQPPAVTGYQASEPADDHLPRHRAHRPDPRCAGRAGRQPDQCGPDFALEHPDAALDEARGQAMAKARARADVYARAAGLGVKRIVAISEAGGYSPSPQPRVFMMARAKEATDLQPGEEKIGVTLQVTFELQ